MRPLPAQNDFGSEVRVLSSTVANQVVNTTIANPMQALTSVVPSSTVKLTAVEGPVVQPQPQPGSVAPTPKAVFASANEYIQNLFVSANSTNDVLKELVNLKNRVDKLEKGAIASQPLPKPKNSVEKLVDSVLSADLLELNSKTVEICATIGCFALGSIISASLLDRLWLVGGILSAYWASGAVYRDTKGGEVARWVGVQLAAAVREIQDKYNGAIIFYQTGILAMQTSKWWEQYDTQFQITKRMDVLKKSAMDRAIRFNSAIANRWSLDRFSDQLTDFRSFIMAAPNTVASLDGRFQLSSSAARLGRGLYSAAEESVLALLERGTEKKSKYPKNKRISSSRASSENRSLFSFLWEPRNRYNPRGNPINPWENPFKTLFQTNRKSSDKQRKRYNY